MRRRSIVLTAIAPLVALVVSCDDVKTDEALDANLRVTNAQFHRGSMPVETAGPLIKSVSLSPIVRPGASDRTCNGVADPTTTAFALSLDGDPGYWIVPAAPPDVTAPGFPTFAATLSFASSLRAGTHTFRARGVDGNGHFGAAFTRALDVAANARPTGRLVIALSWSGHVDLDLHVTDPHGVEIWKRNINSYEPPPPGAPPEPPGTPHVGGILDIDSNASCVPDGRSAENVVWAATPPSGHYQARVDTFSLCAEPDARWRVEAFLEGVSIGAAEGLSTDYDTHFSHDRGAGVLALELDVP